MSTEVLDHPVASAWMKMKFGGFGEAGARVPVGGARNAQSESAAATTLILASMVCSYSSMTTRAAP
jgi:hypothetical protein